MADLSIQGKSIRNPFSGVHSDKTFNSNFLNLFFTSKLPKYRTGKGQFRQALALLISQKVRHFGKQNKIHIIRIKKLKFILFNDRN